MIHIEIKTDDDGNSSVEMKVNKPAVVELQAVNSQLDMVKMKMLGELMKLTDITKNEEEE